MDIIHRNMYVQAFLLGRQQLSCFGGVMLNTEHKLRACMVKGVPKVKVKLANFHHASS